MHFNAMIPIVLTLAGLVSARLSVLSPVATSVWGHNSLQTIKWTTLSEGITNTKLSLYLVCEDNSLTTVLFPIQENLLAASNEFTYHVPTSLKQCEGYFLKFISHDTCGFKQTFFSAMFYITADGTHKQLGTCESDTKKHEEPIAGPKEGQNVPDHPVDDTPTLTTTHTEDVPATSVPTEPSNSQTPITPGDGDHPGITTPGVGEPTSSPSSPEKKPNDIDNHGTVVTFKLFGILLTTITMIIFS